ncbi:MAG: alpha/beta hydrolase [Candidatus Limnocylindria bacterium]
MLLDLALKSVAVVVLGLLILTAIMYVTQRNSLYFPSPSAVGDPPPGLEALEITTDDGLRLGAWFIPAATGRTEAGPAVLVCNGNAGNRSHRLPLADALAERGYHVLLFDYRGYAGNPGSPTEEGLRTDSRAAARALASRPDVDPGRLAYFGESLGASVCGGLASELPPAALILRSPFPSTVEIGRHHYPYLPVVEPLVWDRYPLARQLAEGVRVPLLVVVGERDEIVPPDLSRRVHEAAAEPKRLVEVAAAHHNDEALLAGDELLAELSAFLGEWLR